MNRGCTQINTDEAKAWGTPSSKVSDSGDIVQIRIHPRLSAVQISGSEGLPV